MYSTLSEFWGEGLEKGEGREKKKGRSQKLRQEAASTLRKESKLAKIQLELRM